MLRVHATCVAIGSRGVLLIGESGSGKSDLALRLIDRGAKLVSDDYVEVACKHKKLIANAPHNIQGLLEVRGVGILKMKIRKNIPIAFVVQLVSQEWVERLPLPLPYECLHVQIPCMRLSAFESSAAIKVEMAMSALQDGSMTVGTFKE